MYMCIKETSFRVAYVGRVRFVAYAASACPGLDRAPDSHDMPVKQTDKLSA